jgi:hypothetical protein
VAAMAMAYLICIAFLFLLRPGEYTGTTSDDTPFHPQEAGIYIRDRKLDLYQCSDAELDAPTSGSNKFTTQKNGTRESENSNSDCAPAPMSKARKMVIL